jgi:predicted dehydrogenase
VDYLAQPLSFKVRKVARYIRLYGVSRTYIKVLGQRHKQRKFAQLPPMRGRIADDQFVAIIGCGNFSFTTIAYYLTRTFGNTIGICMDRNIDRAASMSRYYGVPVYTADVARVMEAEQIRLVYIASNHVSHAEYAIDALRHGKHVYIEKPHIVSEDQLERLIDAMDQSTGKVFLGFNRPVSRFGRIIEEYLSREAGPGMYDWFVAGHAIEPDHWYLKPEGGGRVLGNLCHWTDFILRLVPAGTYPIHINPTVARSQDTDIAVTYTFGEGTIATISFSAKGHAFEGVRERFNGHKGNCLMAMDDFRRLTIDVLDVKRRLFNLWRDHGHRQNIVAAYDSVRLAGAYDRTRQRDYIANTGQLFLKTKEALDAGVRVTVHPFAGRTAGADGTGTVRRPGAEASR